MTMIRLLTKFLVTGLAVVGFGAASAAPLSGAISSVGTLCLGSTPSTPTGTACTHQDASTLTYFDFINGALPPTGFTATPGDPGALQFFTALGDDLTPLIAVIGEMHDFSIPGPGDPLSSFTPMTTTWHAVGTDGATYTFALMSLLDIDRLNSHAIDIEGLGTLCRNGTDCNVFSFLFTTQDADGATRTTWSLSQSGFGKVPEPSSLTLLGLGLAGLAFGVRRRRQQ